MKKILVLNHFPTVYPPTSGGTLRYFHLYHKLSQYYDITLLSQSYRHQLHPVEFSPTFREYQAERDSLHNQIGREAQNQNNYEFALIMNVKLSQYSNSYKKYFDILYKKSDIIIHESPYLLGYDQYLGLDDKLRVYNSHNHEYVLADQIWENKKAREFLPSIYELEKRLVEYADLVFVTSRQERDSFTAMYNMDPVKIKLAPNGINPEEWIRNTTTLSAKTRAFFIGAEYPPNVESVHYIIHHLADKCPHIEFIIAGGCCTPFSRVKKSNVKLLGRINNKEKLKLFASVDIAINPMFKGAGVNLKTLEFLSAGIPLFSTQFGVRGLNLIDKKHYINAEQEDFADKLNEFCLDKEHLKEISACGRKYINDNYSWHNIAKSMQEEIDDVINKKN
ncbi:glycosyltransferase family 4 protein [Ectobacillus panaciterrae]|uniref:glycosyltransferase family 4 protein n=1 Tax=Ectobacillus panaciterrae TaxID=363872 RepID=UPI00040CDCF0|nr:glycosyltransferase family 4 protein [Ectobacillus panaciterrae]